MGFHRTSVPRTSCRGQSQLVKTGRANFCDRQQPNEKYFCRVVAGRERSENQQNSFFLGERSVAKGRRTNVIFYRQVAPLGRYPTRVFTRLVVCRVANSCDVTLSAQVDFLWMISKNTCTNPTAVDSITVGLKG